MNAAQRTPPDRLIDFSTAVYVAAGMIESEARLCAEALVQADLWGHQSHGVMRLSWYAARLKTGVCDPRAKPELVIDGSALALIDGHDAMGPVVAAMAADEAIRRAKAYGIGAVGARNSNHFGTAMYFTLMAARAGCVGFLATNASPAMAPWGGRKKVVGTNPWSWACPGGSHAPMALDIANTGVARGKIYLAKQKDEPIPAGWAIDADGAPTTDPVKAIEGIVLPMAQHKGYAIAAMIDMLSGVLTGGGFGAEVTGPYQAQRRSRAGHFMLAVNIETLQPLAEFNARIDTLITELKSVPLAQGFDEVFYPGEIEARNDAKNRAEGVLLPEDTVADMRELADEYGLTSLLPLT
jgi:LDH2 family malate/lactate/ureidoglycolate dehydrogenase